MILWTLLLDAYAVEIKWIVSEIHGFVDFL